MISNSRVSFEEPAPAEVAGGPGMERSFAWERIFSRVRLLWAGRRFLLRVAAAGLAAATLVAFLIPSRYQSTVQLMPPDSQSNGVLALLAGLGGAEGGGLGGQGGLSGLATDLLGVKSTGALFTGVLRSRTVQD